MNLYFPDLIKSKSNYKLNWTGFHALPEPYEQQVQDLVFELNGRQADSYIEEIQRVRNNAIYEWGLQRGRFDTSIREMCLEPAITFTQVYFKLLWDCVADKTLWRSQLWLRYALIYKMWLGQTGGGCVFRNAGLHELKRVSKRSDDTISNEQYEILMGLTNFRREMTKFQENGFSGLKRKSYWISAPEGAYIPETYVSPFTGKEA